MAANTMRAHIVQHVPFEGPGSIESWLSSNGYQPSRTRLYESTDFPDPRVIDLLIVMGGPMSVNDHDQFPWLNLEKAFIQEFIMSGKPVLGICLGAQLIAHAMGARVYANSVREIGWFPIHAVDSSDGSSFRFPPSEVVFHWHGETFDLPQGAIQLARSEGCEIQAFQLGRRVIGLQFHLEITPESARELVAHCRQDLVPSKYVQTEAEILSASSGYYETTTNLLGEILSFLQHQDD